jgi:hypothetical protein
MSNSTTPSKNISPVGRVSYPNVFRPRAVEEGKDPQFSLALLFDKSQKDELAEMRAKVEAAKKEKWGDKVPKNFRTPFRDGNEKEGAEYQDKIFINLKAKENRPPQVVGPDKQPISESSGDFYPGCFARVSYTVYAYEVRGNAGVSFGLGNIQKVKDGEPFDGRRDAEDEFEAVAGSESSSSGGDVW